MSQKIINIKEITKLAVKPELYTPGNRFMWNDPHISKLLLETHLNENIDLASRKPKKIELTLNWILSQMPNRTLDILDLGCGPGLYTSKLATKGHSVTGIDISPNSIEYAKQKAVKEGQRIQYRNENYLEAELETAKYDLIIMIYTDFGVLNPEQRRLLLVKIKKALKPEGVFIFDILNDTDWRKKTTPINWESSLSGFWKPTPCLVLSNSFLYENDHVILYQHIIVDETGHTDSYRFWTHFLPDNEIKRIVDESGFGQCTIARDVLSQEGPWDENNVSFINCRI